MKTGKPDLTKILAQAEGFNERLQKSLESYYSKQNTNVN